MSLPQSPEDQKAMDELVTLKVGVLFLLGVAGSGGALWLRGVAWLVEHQVLVAADQGPLLALPGSGGAGLDGPRVLIAAAALLALVAFGISSLLHALTHRRHRRYQ